MWTLFALSMGRYFYYLNKERRMKTLILSSVLATSILPLSAFAQTPPPAGNPTGNITFSGQIREQTCVIRGEDANKVVIMPTVGTNQLVRAGDTAGETRFTLGVSGCGASSNNAVFLRFFQNSGFDAAGRFGSNASNGARNVLVEVRNRDNQIVRADGGTAKLSDVATNGSATVDLTARYYASGQATAGPVQAQSRFEITYQ